MKDYFKVTDLDQVLKCVSEFEKHDNETVDIHDSAGRILAEEIVSDIDLPGFTRSTMDGFAVVAASTFGASAGSPAFLELKGAVSMGEEPEISVTSGQAAGIPTGGMLPAGADSVVMIEHTELIDDSAIEVMKSVAPGQNIIEKGEDFQKGKIILSPGSNIRSAETGLMAAFGINRVKVFQKPVVGIISTGDEVVPITDYPPPGHIRDINTYTLSAMVRDSGGIPIHFGIVKDDSAALKSACDEAIDRCDMVLISGGSSVGLRDYTVDVLSGLPDSQILVHGISISPGKPTILASVGGKPFWGLPGHVVSAMVVFDVVVKPFLEKISGRRDYHRNRFTHSAILSRNVASAQGREEFIRVKTVKKDGAEYAEPVLGKSGMINTMIHADGLIRIPLNTEGLDKGTSVNVCIL